MLSFPAFPVTLVLTLLLGAITTSVEGAVHLPPKHWIKGLVPGFAGELYVTVGVKWPEPELQDWSFSYIVKIGPDGEPDRSFGDGGSVSYHHLLKWPRTEVFHLRPTTDGPLQVLGKLSRPGFEYFQGQRSKELRLASELMRLREAERTGSNLDLGTPLADDEMNRVQQRIAAIESALREIHQEYAADAQERLFGKEPKEPPVEPTVPDPIDEGSPTSFGMAMVRTYSPDEGKVVARYNFSQQPSSWLQRLFVSTLTPHRKRATFVESTLLEQSTAVVYHILDGKHDNPSRIAVGPDGLVAFVANLREGGQTYPALGALDRDGLVQKDFFGGPHGIRFLTSDDLPRELQGSSYVPLDLFVDAKGNRALLLTWVMKENRVEHRLLEIPTGGQRRRPVRVVFRSNLKARPDPATVSEEPEVMTFEKFLALQSISSLGAISPDGTRLCTVVSSPRGIISIRLYDLSVRGKGRRIARTSLASEPVRMDHNSSMAFDPHGNVILLLRDKIDETAVRRISLSPKLKPLDSTAIADIYSLPSADEPDEHRYPRGNCAERIATFNEVL